ncbi:MAG: DUF2339 domain-containing protein [Lachnospiraceae bacterium]|nr:DUF2339 domain-containing protein [Lachnospiraceae bacterium]
MNMFNDLNKNNVHNNVIYNNESNKNLNNIEASILNYENRLLTDRKQLNDLIYEYNNQNVNSSILDYKIKYLQTEIDYMNNQLSMLRMGMQERMKDSESQHTVIKRIDAMPQQQAQNMQYQNAMSQPQVPHSQPQNKADKPKDLENMIGKSWMGIFASILIFISFILFATLLAPFITDTIKMIAMYVVSILLTTFGLLKLRKNNNKLYLAISSCGIGAVYISLLLTNLYFKAIGDIALYVFILVWAVFVCYLSKWQDRIFQIIGQCGITIALFFGIILCAKTHDSTKLLLLSLFFAVTAAIFYVSNYSREFHENIVNNAFNCINVFQLLMGICVLTSAISFWNATSEELERHLIELAEYNTKVNIISAGIIIFLILQFVLYLITKLKEKNTGFGIFTIINTILLMLYIANITYSNDGSNSVTGIIFIIIGVALLAVAEKKFDNRKDDGKVLIQCFTLPVFIISVSMIPFFRSHIGVSFVMILFILLGYYKDDYVYKYMSLLTAVIYCLSDLKYSVEYLCLGLLFFAVLGVCMYVKKEQYSGIFKQLSYVAGFFFIIISLTYVLGDLNVSYDVDMTIMITVVSALNMFAMKSRFVKDFKTLQTEKHSVNVTRTINAMLMVVSLYKVMAVDNEICHFILVLMAIMIFVANTKNLVEQNKDMWPGIYIGVKLTVLLITILCSYEAANYVISISAFLFAIISIVLGFRFYVKSFRIYGLFLSMFSVAKLILVDISYDNTLGHALSFFICGILCFIISMIYHLIDKKMQVK